MTGNQDQDKDFYIEEITPGKCFQHNDKLYMITSDQKSSGQRLCYSLNNGNARWLDPNTIVKTVSLYHIDKDNNIIPVVNEHLNNNE